MKARIHIDIGQFEFVDFEFTEEDKFTFAVLAELYEKYHKMGDKLIAKESAKQRIQKSKEVTEVDKLEAL